MHNSNISQVDRSLLKVVVLNGTPYCRRCRRSERPTCPQRPTCRGPSPGGGPCSTRLQLRTLERGEGKVPPRTGREPAAGEGEGAGDALPSNRRAGCRDEEVAETKAGASALTAAASPYLSLVTRSQETNLSSNRRAGCRACRSFIKIVGLLAPSRRRSQSNLPKLYAPIDSCVYS